jgi:uncharacterized membrane protein YraQ (UPF0718 family)
VDIPPILQRFFDALIDMTLDAAPWLVVGLVAAGLMKALVPTDRLSRWLGGPGLGSILRAAVIGTPLPLCSCSVLPAAVQLRRGGASKGATASFLVATPENGADSIAISYALLGPVMTVARVVAALMSAVIAGVAATALGGVDEPGKAKMNSPSATSCCGSKTCCGTGGTSEGPGATAVTEPQAKKSLGAKLAMGLRYAGTDLLGDIAGWTALGLLIAAAISALVPAEGLAEVGQGIGAMGVMLVVGLPLYICATASTPLAASLLMAGVGPGAVLVLLLAGPATNVGAIMVVRRELGGRAAAGYLLGVAGGAVASGLMLEWLMEVMGWDMAAAAGEAGEVIPRAVAWGCAAVLIGLTGWRRLRRR